MHVKQLFTSNTWHVNNTTHTRLIITFICAEVLAGALGLGPNGLDAAALLYYIRHCMQRRLFQVNLLSAEAARIMQGNGAYPPSSGNSGHAVVHVRICRHRSGAG